MKIHDLQTPCLLLDRRKMTENIRRMADRIDRLGGVLRPHVKTHKSIDVWRHVEKYGPVRGLTVSTMREAAYFFEHGVKDILYAVGVSPGKFEAVAELITRGCALTVTLDSVEMAERLARDGEARGVAYPVLIELDVDGHRAGVDPKGRLLLDIAAALGASSGATLRGVMTHAGESYLCDTAEGLAAAARQERDSTVLAAKRLRAAGHDAPVVSIGSTPTACAVEDLTDVTEVRPGVYTFYDLVMRGVGVCATEDIAVSVLTSVIGHQKERGWALVDAGWMAMSRDRGTAGQSVDYGYGEVCDANGAPMKGLAVMRANQEHGVIVRQDGGEPPWDSLPIGAMARILPNHACATAAQYAEYKVIDGEDVVGVWPRIGGW